MKLWPAIRRSSGLALYLKACALFFLLFAALALGALSLVIKEQADPFFYARF